MCCSASADGSGANGCRTHPPPHITAAVRAAAVGTAAPRYRAAVSVIDASSANRSRRKGIRNTRNAQDGRDSKGNDSMK
jgi:hypothetical protein